MVFLDEIQFMDTKDTLNNVEIILNKGIDVVCAGLDQDSEETVGNIFNATRFV